MSLDDRLSEIACSKVDLTNGKDDPLDNSPHRPELRIWAEGDEPAHVVLTVAALWGQQTRHVDLVPHEARLLARELTAMADAVDRVIEDAAEKAWDRHQEKLMEDGPGPSLLDQQREAMKLK